jgi:serine/threonine-protein kinase
VLAAKPGESIGNYRLLGKLGSGGMGVVYAAEHVLLGRRAAIKFLRPEVSSEPTIVERFFTEARAASAVRHPGIVEVYDFGYHEKLAYLVMEYLDGETLRTCLRAEGRITPDRAVPIALHIASALEAAHSAGVVHRDLKPDNVFLAKATAPDLSRRTQQLLIGPRVCILDFGVAKLVRNEGESNPNITTSDVVVGTPTFMSPEQCRGGGNVDGRADLYSLGCILYAMLCARPPFVGTGSGDILAQHIYQAPDPPRWYAPDVSADLEAIMLRLLEKDPARRYQSAHELARALRVLPLAGDPVATTTVHGGPPPPAPAPTPVPAPIARESSSPSFAPVAGASSPSMPQFASSSGLSSPSMASMSSYGSLPHPRRSRAALIWICSILGVAFVGGAIALAVAQSNGPEQSAPPAPAATEPQQAVATFDAAPHETASGELLGMVRLDIDSEPAGAEIFRQGQSQRLGRTPFSVKQPPEPGYVTFELKLHGYETELVSMPTDKSGETRATLRRAVAPRPPGKSGTAAGKKKDPVPAIKDTRRTSGPDDTAPPPHEQEE